MTEPRKRIELLVSESIRVKTAFFSEYASAIVQAAGIVAGALREHRKVLLFGNGGSAADAQHIAAELVGRFIPERRPLPAISLSTDTSILTAVANDYGYNAVFARQILAYGAAGDVAIGISTSGNSANVLEGLNAARERGLATIGWTGQDGGKMQGCVDLLFRVPSRTTPRIQETHLTLGHVLCELVDRELFPEAYGQDSC